MSSRTKRLLVNLGFVIVNTLLCIGVTEVVARIWENNLAQSSDGWELVATRRMQTRPNADYDFTLLLHPPLLGVDHLEIKGLSS